MTASPAFALSQVFSASFGSPGSGAGQLSLALSGLGQTGSGVAVDESTGDVYVADTGNERVDKFTASGQFILSFGQNVDRTTGGNICTAASGDTCQAGTTGPGQGAFSDPAWVAVDNSGGPSAGDVYVGSRATTGVSVKQPIVSKFTASGAFLSDIDGSSSNSPGAAGKFLNLDGVTVDPQGNLWVYDHAFVYEFGQNGVFAQAWEDQVNASLPADLTVDGDHVFLVNGDGRARRYGTSGEFQGLITRGDTVPQHLALDPATEDLYVDNAVGTVIDHYNASCSPDPALGTPPPSRAGCAPNDVIGSGDFTNIAGLALNHSTSALYVTDAGTDQVKVFVPPSPGAPAITDEWADRVGASAASVDATANPNGNDTTCELQYTDDAGFQANGYTGATAVPCDPFDLGSRFADHPVQVQLAGLAPGTTYHYRFTLSSSGGTDIGADHVFATELPDPNLPDGRAYEQVSPVEKDGAGLFTTRDYVASADGVSMGFVSGNALPGSVADGENYLSARGLDGWTTTGQIPPQSPGDFFCPFHLGIAAHSGDLSQSVLEDGYGQTSLGCGKDSPELVTGEPAGVQNLFIRDNDTGTYRLISQSPVAGPPADAFFDAADPGFTHLVFDEAAQLTADAPAGVDSLYDYSGGTVRLVSIDPTGTPLPAGATIAGGALASARHAVSDDGSTIFFQGSDGNLYARLGGARTVQIDASQGSGPGGGGQFQWASADGTKAFFTDDASAGLTSDTQPGSATNLYRYDFATGRLTDLTPAAQAGVLGVSGVGDSGQDAYFVATGDLAGGATSGQPNLYVSDNGALSFIGTLSSDAPNTCVWDYVALCARVSADGSHLAFNSDRSLTAVDTGGFTEVYLYHAGTGALVCASCAPAGAQVTAPASIAPATTFTAFSTPEVLSRNLSADGSRLFFTANGPLVGRDSNDQPDVYEYENGHVYLISSGTATTPSTFLDASANGNDVFFATAQRLLPSDIDGALDIYDARVGGGFPQPTTTPCAGDACKPLPPAAPLGETPGSVSYSGPGNATPATPGVVAHITVLHKRFKRGQVVLTLKLPEGGALAVFGPGLNGARKSVRHGGIYQLTLTLSPRRTSTLKGRRRLSVSVSIMFLPSGGLPSLTTAALTLTRGGRR